MNEEWPLHVMVGILFVLVVVRSIWILVGR